jgi:hypothetical protein
LEVHWRVIWTRLLMLAAAIAFGPSCSPGVVPVGVPPTTVSAIVSPRETALPAATSKAVAEATTVPQPSPEKQSEGLPRPDARSEDDRLPTGALVGYQQISLGMQIPGNYRWILYEDGRWFLSRNSASYSGQRGDFEFDLPTAPTRILPSDIVREVRDQLRAADFLSLEPQFFDPTMQDGARMIVTARLDGRVHEVTYDGASSPLVDYLKRFAWRHEPDARK